jgi:uncharacterized membrane protein YkvA (DUF1232 family)
MEKIKNWAKRLKKQIFILYFACKDTRVPWYAKAFTAGVVAYTFSPIDLIPDFIPILGYLDEVILVPIGIMFALKMIPQAVIADCEIKAEKMMNQGRPKNWIAGSLILVLWGILFFWLSIKIYQYIQ